MVTGAVQSRVRRGGRVALSIAVVAALGALSFAVASVSGGDDLRLVTAGVLVAVVVATAMLCAHAGGHALFLPLLALGPAVAWAVTVTGPSAPASWWLVAMSATVAAVGVSVGSRAWQQSLRARPPVAAGPQGASGTAVTSLTPVGVVRVAGETWTARSLSGVLPAGAPVHVVRVDGVRLDVWSEVGTVPDHLTLDSEEEQI